VKLWLITPLDRDAHLERIEWGETGREVQDGLLLEAGCPAMSALRPGCSERTNDLQEIATAPQFRFSERGTEAAEVGGLPGQIKCAVHSTEQNGADPIASHGPSRKEDMNSI
jgi:hypothetical protein